jgi:SAM-dependent methyltransferase
MCRMELAPHVWGTAPTFIGPRHRLRESLLLRLLLRGSRPPASVLNVGAGQGTFTRLLEERGFAVTSTDLSPHAVDVLRRQVAGPVVECDACALPFPDCSFDVVVMGEVLEHIADDRQALAEARRVLRPGGMLVASVPAHPERFGPADQWAGHHRRYERADLVAKCEHAKLRVSRCRAWGFPFSALYHFRLYQPRLAQYGTGGLKGGASKRAALRALLSIDRLFVGVELGSLGYLLRASR